MENIFFDKDKFITIIQNPPALWDQTSSDYSDRIKKARVWREVMAEMYKIRETDTFSL